MASDDSIRVQLEVFQADLIADFLVITETVETRERTVRTLRDNAEVVGLVLVLLVCLICLIVGLVGIPTDLLVAVPNAGLLLYRHLRDI